MQVAILLYPDFTSLDAMGPYEVFARLPDTEVLFVAENPGAISNEMGGLSVNVVASLDDVTSPDVVLVPGGPGRLPLLGGGKTLDWLRAVDRTTTWTTSVCTGALILAAAGLLEGRKATTHWKFSEQLTEYGVIPSTDRVVFDGKYVSGAGVSAGIDLAFTLAGTMFGDDVARTVQLIIEYAPEPPYDSGSLKTASPAVLELANEEMAKLYRNRAGAAS